MRLTVIGTGYLGATHAACMADLGYEVLGLDVDEQKVASLNAGTVPFFEPELDEVLQRALASGRLRFTTSFEEVGAFGDVHFLCVGTPQTKGGVAADLSQVNGAVDALAPHLTGPCLVVGKSTVPVGTAARLAARIAELAPAGADAELAWNPEFLREGFAVQDTVSPDRLVVGVTSGTAEKRLREVYAPLIAKSIPFIVTDLPTAELVKTSANAFLATKISFINAMAELCEATGADVATLAEAIGHDERIGKRFLRAGLGFGGGCLPKDIRAFRARAEELGVGDALAFLDDIDAINLRRRARTIEVITEFAGGSVDGVRIAVLGAAFKPDSDDIRDSPALDVAAALHAAGAEVALHDPEAMTNAARVHPDLTYAASIDEALAGARVTTVLTEWRQFSAIDPEHAAALVAAPLMVDARNCLPRERWASAGWRVHTLGRAEIGAA
jgi:UDPglucose 6-dehydrogenase